MDQKIVIGISVAVAIAVICAVHSVLHKLVKFKMDESAILRFVKDFNGNCKAHSTAAISLGTGIAIERVAVVCAKRKNISMAQ